ncbi:hypothetical protein C8J57DRAFT_1218504 [Mycena rebaudengoi]|nr:hypothetical protein C8J57DRAFT_1218504 [Mycena rebaudengoi]
MYKQRQLRLDRKTSSLLHQVPQNKRHRRDAMHRILGQTGISCKLLRASVPSRSIVTVWGRKNNLKTLLVPDYVLVARAELLRPQRQQLTPSSPLPPLEGTHIQPALLLTLPHACPIIARRHPRLQPLVTAPPKPTVITEHDIGEDRERHWFLLFIDPLAIHPLPAFLDPARTEPMQMIRNFLAMVKEEREAIEVPRWSCPQDEIVVWFKYGAS